MYTLVTIINSSFGTATTFSIPSNESVIDAVIQHDSFDEFDGTFVRAGQHTFHYVDETTGEVLFVINFITIEEEDETDYSANLPVDEDTEVRWALEIAEEELESLSDEEILREHIRCTLRNLPEELTSSWSEDYWITVSQHRDEFVLPGDEPDFELHVFNNYPEYFG